VYWNKSNERESSLIGKIISRVLWIMLSILSINVLIPVSLDSDNREFTPSFSSSFSSRKAFQRRNGRRVPYNKITNMESMRMRRNREGLQQKVLMALDPHLMMMREKGRMRKETRETAFLFQSK